MRKKLILVFIMTQLLVLGFMAGEREYIFHTGKRIYLRTAPVDPRDLFRGDYVRLDYEISPIKGSHIRGTVNKHLTKKGYKVYAVLKSGQDDLYVLDYLTDKKPAGLLFIAGRVDRGWRVRRPRDGTVVKYGIEQYFVEQGRGKEIENRRGRRDDLQIPMEVELAVSDNGTAVIRDYRWSKMGLKLEMLRFNRRNRNANRAGSGQPLSPKLRITLQNVSDETLWLADPDHHCGFKLVPIHGVGRKYTTIDTICRDVVITQKDLIQLKSAQSYSVELDLSVNHDGMSKLMTRSGRSANWQQGTGSVSSTNHRREPRHQR